ncbi:hypothetical protein MP228_002980 [Amoeboaphelidium protococcarum]|nr:hypothetical protein MP228_002980 [Amoeboaphelidium protococcarum]
MTGKSTTDQFALEEASEEDVRLISQYLDHIELQTTAEGLVNLPKLWRKLPSADSNWTNDEAARKQLQRWKASEQYQAVMKLHKGASPSDIGIEFVYPFVRRLRLDTPIKDFAVESFKRLERQVKASQDPQTTTLPAKSDASLQSHHASSQEDGKSDSQNAQLGSADKLPSNDALPTSNDGQSDHVRPKLQENVSYTGQMVSSSGNALQPKHGQVVNLYQSVMSVSANIAVYLPDAQSMPDAIWEMEMVLSQLPRVLPIRELKSAITSPQSIGSWAELLWKDVNRLLGGLTSESWQLVQGVVASVLRALCLPHYSQEIGLLCCVFLTMYAPEVAADLVSRLYKATGAWNLPQLEADCRVLENLIASEEGYTEVARFRQGWFEKCYVVNWMASCYSKNAQNIYAKLPTWSTFCYAEDPQRAFLAIAVLHALSELPNSTEEQFNRAVAVKPGNLVTAELLESSLYQRALTMCMDTEFNRVSYAGNVKAVAKRNHASCFQMDHLKAALPTVVAPAPISTENLSRCHQCNGEKIADCMSCNQAFCNEHQAVHADHPTTLESSDGDTNSSLLLSNVEDDSLSLNSSTC